MAKIIETTGKTVEDALSVALEDLGVTIEDVEYEILEKPSKGFLGFGAKPAKIQVKLKEIPPEVKLEVPQPVSKFEVQVEEKIEPVLEETKMDSTETELKATANEISEPVLDRNSIIDRAKVFLADVFDAMEIEVTINIVETESEVILDLQGKNLGALIGKHGQTLDALQYLTNLAANIRDSEDKIYFVLDVENYRQRRAQALTKLAKSVAERAIRTRKDVKLEPMSRSERKVIHTALQNNPKVETHSAGEDPYRYIIVSLKKKR